MKSDLSAFYRMKEKGAVGKEPLLGPKRKEIGSCGSMQGKARKTKRRVDMFSGVSMSLSVSFQPCQVESCGRGL